MQYHYGSKQREQERLRKQTQAFLNQGGKIDKIETPKYDNRSKPVQHNQGALG